MRNFPSIGTEVVRSKGDYTVGRTGFVVALDEQKNRVQVEWIQTRGGFPVTKRWDKQTKTWEPATLKTWVKIEVIEPTSIPYQILDPKPSCPRTGRMFNPIYTTIS